MVRGLGKTKVKKKPWKTRMERDIVFSKDIKESGLQGGKAIGEIVKLKKVKKWVGFIIYVIVVVIFTMLNTPTK